MNVYFPNVLLLSVTLIIVTYSVDLTSFNILWRRSFFQVSFYQMLRRRLKSLKKSKLSQGNVSFSKPLLQLRFSFPILPISLPRTQG